MLDKNYLISSGIEIDKSLEILGDLNTYNDILKEFIDNINTKINDIKLYASNKDLENYAILVHSLKSDSKYLGFTTLANIALEHEMKSKENDILFIKNNLNDLIDETNHIISIASKYLGINNNDNSNIKKKLIINNPSILVVDDSDLVRKFINKTFKDKIPIIEANDGIEAINIIKNNNNKNILGILLDINMPNLNGYDVLDYLANNNLFDTIPVTIITGNNTKESINRIHKYPIKDLLIKPFNETDIINTINKITKINV